MSEVDNVYIPKRSRTSVNTTDSPEDSIKPDLKTKNYGRSSRTNKKDQDNKKTEIDRKLQAVETVKKYKEGIEANIIGCLCKNSELLLDSKLKDEDFSYSSWGTFFKILSHLYLNGKTISEDNIDFYLLQHPDLAENYHHFNGWDTLLKARSVINENDFNGYLADLYKWNAVLKLAEIGFTIDDKLNKFVDLTAEDIYREYTGRLDAAFINIEEEVKSYNAFENVRALNDLCDLGTERGYDFGKFGEINSFPILNMVINGFSTHGQIYGLGAVSGMGKSTMAINYIFPMVLETKQPAVFLINEEDQTKFQREAETWIINNIILKDEEGKSFNKKRFSEGRFTEEEKNWLNQAADFMESRQNEHLITVIPMERYSAPLAIKIIRKYAKLLDVKIFVLDTFKEGSDIGNAETWKAMERDMRSFYDTIKEAALNVGLFVTYQLGKQSIKTRYLTDAEVGQARNIVDVMSVNIMIRRPFPEEGYDGRKELYYLKHTRNPNDSTLYKTRQNASKNYMITFITKNRRGQTDPYQILSECNFATNEIQDVGICYVPQDF